ncbi:MAG: ribosome maturation factor RimP [Lachnospiraceae bacterium]|nr:ribosome maturation factor RimP [Lachnospiraceae bacterium]
MTKREEYEKRTEELLTPITAAHGFEIVDVEFVKEGGNRFLRAYIDKPDGITVDDCETISRALGARLDEEDFIEESYILEVSSPGLGRPLKKEKDFIRNMGELVELHTFRPIDRQKEFCGILKAYDKDTVTIEQEDGAERVFERSMLALIRQAVIW